MKFISRNEGIWIAPVLAIASVALLLSPIVSYDIWWHLDSGRWMLENGRYLGTEIRSFSLQGEHWPNFAWLFQVSVALVEAAGGPWGLLGLKALVWLTVFWLLIRSAAPRKNLFYAATLAMLVVVQQAAPFMHLRPHLFEALFLVLSILVFSKERKREDWWIYAALILVWANSHASVAVGAPALLLHFVFGRSLPFRIEAEHIKRMAIAAPMGLLVFATPNGLDILQVLTGHASGKFMYDYIMEWWPPTQVPVLIALGFSAVVIGASVLRGILSISEIFLLGFFAWMAVSSERFLFELSFLLFRPLTLLFLALFEKLQEHLQAVFVPITGILLGAVLWMSAPPPIHAKTFALRDYPVMNDRYPGSAMGLLKRLGSAEHPLRILNTYEWGGFLSWHGHGHWQIYIDGRTPTVFTETMMIKSVVSMVDAGALAKLGESHEAEIIVLRRRKPLPFAPDHPLWKIVHFDAHSIVYAHNSLVEREQLTTLSFNPFQVAETDDVALAEARAMELTAVLRDSPNNAAAHYQLGRVLSGAGNKNLKEAAEHLRRAVELNADYVPARLDLAELEHAVGKDANSVAQWVLPIVDNPRAQRLVNRETRIATLLLAAGYVNQALKVMAPDRLKRRRELNTDFNVWMLRMLAFDMLGQHHLREQAREMARLLADNEDDKKRMAEMERSLELANNR